jgi:hypothetical protein
VKRNIASCCVLACALIVPSIAVATSRAPALASTARIQARGSVTGTIINVGWSSFTIQTPSRRIGIVAALTRTANTVSRQDYPYVYGGGHEQAGVASVGIPGPGYNGRRIGYDCSGSVAAVLGGAGLWPPGSGVPNDAGIISQLLSEHLIARGVGVGPVEVTLYDHPGVHIFMNIDGRFFGTSDGAGAGGNSRGGAGWLDDGAPDASSPAFTRYHLIRAVLRGSTSTGHIVTFQAGRLSSGTRGLRIGDKVRVSYEETGSGKMIATAVTFPDALTASGVVESISYGARRFTVQTANGVSLAFSTGGLPRLLDGVAVGDTVQVTYTKNGATMTARAVKVTATPVSGGGGSSTTTSSSS